MEKVLLSKLTVLLFLFSTTTTQDVGCPQACLCFHRDNGRVVRCMFLGLTEIPVVPKDTTILDLRFNRISEISPGTFAGLSSLYTLLLNSNELKTLSSGAFSGLENLKYLYLYKNKIESLDSNTFSGLKKVEQLFLHNNQLKTIPIGSLTPLTELTRLRLDSNPLICDCNLKWLKNYTTHNSNLMEVAATCVEPENLNGLSITDIENEDFNCPTSTIQVRQQSTSAVPSRSSQTLSLPQDSSKHLSSTPSGSMKIPELTAQPADVEASLGDRVYMNCAANGEPQPAIAWFHNQSEIISNDVEPSSRYHILSDGRLMIDGATTEDQGSYGCLAQNDAGEAVSGPAILLLRTNTLQSEERPEFILKPRDQTTSLGGSISLTCTAAGSAELQWYKDGRPYVLDSTRSTLLSSGILLITDVVSTDAGIYRCSISIGNEAVHASATVSVQAMPHFVEEPTSTSVVEGGTAYFTCETTGFPKPYISWSKDGETLGSDVRFTTSLNGTNLRISQVEVVDSGQYECEASNILATVSSYAQLTVRRQVPPTFTSSPAALTAELTSSVTIQCSAAGDPDPAISWHRNGAQISSDDDEKYEVNGENFLTINNLTLEDAGSYDCQAVSSAGSAQLHIHLQIVGAAEKVYPGDVFVEEAVSTARSEVNRAVDATIHSFQDRDKPLTSSDLIALFKFPSQGAQTIARSAEIFERTLELISEKVHSAKKIEIENSDTYSNVHELLSPNQIRLISELSGCEESRAPIDCTNMCFHMKYRTIDGTCNNLHRPMVGSSLTKFSRWLPAVYENNFNLPVGWNASKLHHGFPKPSARLVSTQIMSAHEIQADDRFTSFLMQWGQFLDHDITLTPMSVSRSRFSDGQLCNSTCDNQAPCFPIQTPEGDPRLAHRKCIGMTRSSAACGSGMTSVFFNKITHREQLNELTAFIDASNVYGSEQEHSRSLRNLARNTGLLKTGLLQTTSGKNLLPFNTRAPMDCQIDPQKTHIPCFLAGDLRANEQLGLLSVHTLFVREHNRIATELSTLNPHWDGDMVYYETRKILGAIMQHITYQHWLPKIIGPVGMSIVGEYKGYNPHTDPTVLNVFATAAFRFGHSLINPILYRLNSTMQKDIYGHLPLHKAFFAPFRIIEEGGIDPIIRGLYGTAAKMPTSSQIFNEELTEKLFKLAHSVSLDLAALNIQRGRDHGLPSYNEWRKKCGLGEAFTFDDLVNEIPDVKIRMKLEQIYGHPGNVDLFVGGMVEKLLPGARVGQTFTCILAEQFRRLRDGDRFYYESPGVFSPDQLVEIKQVTLSHIICMSADNITEIPADVFKLSQYPRQFHKCDSNKLPKLNLKVWSHCCHNCDNSGDFQSITHNIISRNRRSADYQYSYSEDKPSTSGGNAAPTSHQTERHLYEERIDGLEHAIDKFSQLILSLQDKIDELEKTTNKEK